MLRSSFHPELPTDLSTLLKHWSLTSNGEKYRAYREISHFLKEIFTPEVWSQWDTIYAIKYQGWEWGTQDLVYNDLIIWGSWIIDRTWTLENMNASEETKQFLIADIPQRMRAGWKTGIRIARVAVGENWGKKTTRMLGMLPLEVFRAIELSGENKPHMINSRNTGGNISPRVGCPAARHFSWEETPPVFNELWKRVQVIHNDYCNLVS
jgi:hypothetical protein